MYVCIHLRLCRYVHMGVHMSRIEQITTQDLYVSVWSRVIGVVVDYEIPEPYGMLYLRLDPITRHLARSI